ncbi:phage integrase SAM-like domain-containing protein [Spirosoma sp. KUDC1026]|uniref:phage integrase SAM-like domain-containing protein n=1 Tax=Spirosoma sp. KUDC1026 TaxID=2745947 RepID=UPI00159BB616|nr:phage integrase SAM-like domain-containing protein [Spirosoma sp. KUDC1026]QKZ14198.1 phage integrase SAM-like domain-containing protein [Spirosoma sp. KUDC1026]
MVPYWKARNNEENANRYDAEFTMIERYLATLSPKRTDVVISAINEEWFYAYFDWLRNKPRPVKSDYTFRQRLGQIKAVIRLAFKKGAIPAMPKFEIKPNLQKGRKPKLDNDQLQRMETLDYITEQLQKRNRARRYPHSPVLPYND